MAKLVVKTGVVEEVLFSQAVVRVVFRHNDSQNLYYIYLNGNEYYVLPSSVVDFNDLVKWANGESDLEIDLE